MKKIDVTRIEKEQRHQVKDPVIREISLHVTINDSKTIILPCSGQYVNEMLTGYLYTNGYIQTPGDIRSLEYGMKEEKAAIWLDQEKKMLDGLKPQADMKLPSLKIFELMEEFVDLSGQFQQTGAVHTAALASNKGITKYFDDISRHNAIDMIIGWSMLHNEPFDDKCLLLTCRISGSIISKVVVAGLPMVVSTSAPTDQAVETAKTQGIAMAGFVRGKRMNVYNREECFT